MGDGNREIMGDTWDGGDSWSMSERTYLLNCLKEDAGVMSSEGVKK